MAKHRYIGWLPLVLCWVVATASAGNQSTFEVPRTAPPLQVQDLRKQPQSLADYRGKVVLVNFWASWCGPCIKEIPSLRELYRRLAGEPFEILAVNLKENAFKVDEFSRLLKMPFPVLMDPKGKAFAAWDAEVLPTSFLVDAEGRVRHEVIGPLDWASDRAVQTIRALLPAPGASTSTPGVRETDATRGRPAG